MKIVSVIVGVLLLAALGAGVWILVRHPEWVKGAAEEDEDAVEVPAEVPVRVGKVTRATLHRYVEGFGSVEAQPAQGGNPAASARVASPVAGLVAEVLCAPGQRVERGAPLFQLDERTAKAEEDKAAAAVASAQASLAKLKSFPRPDQIKVAEMQIDRARKSVDYSTKKRARIADLATDRLASERSLQEAELELATAQSELAVAEKQLALLKSTPTREEIGEAEGKVVEAERGLAASRTARSLLRISSPLPGSVVRVKVNAGEAVDLTTVLAEIVDLDRLVVEGTVPAAQLRPVAVGMDVEVRPGGEESKDSVRGKVSWIGLDVDRKNDTGFVRIALPAKAGLRPGQFVRIRIVVEEHQDHLVVPRESIIETPEGKSAVMGFLGEKAIRKEVRVGIREGDLVEIEGEEVDEGDVVVTRGAYGLGEESKVRIVKEK